MHVLQGKMSQSSVDLSSYRDQHFKGSRNDQERLLRTSTTMYVGNLSFFTTEEQLYELFGKCGDVKRIIMGLDKFKRTPCGFCFVEYYTREESENAQRYINGTRYLWATFHNFLAISATHTLKSPFHGIFICFLKFLT